MGAVRPNRFFRGIVLSAAGGIAACSLAIPSARGAVAYDFEDRLARVATSGAIDRTFGWEFTVSQPITLTHLGYFDAGNTQPTNPPDGLFVQHPVGLWTAAGALLSSGAVASGTQSPEFQSFRYADVPDVTLSPGVNYIVAAFSPNGNYAQQTFDPFPDFASDWIFPAPGGGFEVRQPVVDYAPGVSLVRTRYVLFNPGMTFPSLTLDGDAGVGGVNFMFQPVPEPASAALLAFVAPLAMRRRRSPLP